MGWWVFAFYVASFLVGALLRKRPEGPKPEKVQPPEIEDGEPVAYLFGTMKVSPSLLWYGDVTAVAVKKPNKVLGITTSRTTVGYKYLVGLQGGLCWGPVDELVDIVVDEKYSLASYGTLSERVQAGPGDLSVTATADVISPDLPASQSAGGTAFTVNHPGLFGGRDKEGGISGTVRFYFGTQDQGENSYLATKVVSPFPSYKRLCYVVFEHTNWGQTPYLKPWAFVLRRIPTTLGTLAGDTTLSRIGDDANPAEVLWEILTGDDRYALGGSSTGYEVASFTDALETLHSEGLGVSGAIKDRNTDSLVQDLLRTIDGVLRHDPKTGLISLKLIRADYTVADLLTLDNSNCDDSRPARALWGDLTTEVKVRYTDAEAGYRTRTRQAQNLAARQMTGKPIAVVRDYPLVTVASVAETVATRDVASLSHDLFKTTIICNRSAASLAPGDAFVHTWVKDGETVCDALVMRVTTINYGTISGDDHIELEAVEDVFGQSGGVYVGGSDDTFTPPPATGAGAKFTVEPVFTLDATEGCLELVINGDPTAITDVSLRSIAGDGTDSDWTAFAVDDATIIKLCVDRDQTETGTLSFKVSYTDSDSTTDTIEDTYDVPPLLPDDALDPGVPAGTPGNWNWTLVGGVPIIVRNVAADAYEPDAFKIFRKYFSTSAIGKLRIQLGNHRASGDDVQACLMFSVDGGGSFAELGPVVRLDRINFPEPGAYADLDAGAIGPNVMVTLGLKGGTGVEIVKIANVVVDSVSSTTPPDSPTGDPGDLPTGGAFGNLVLDHNALTIADALGLVDDDPVTSWPDDSPSGNDAALDGIAQTAPTYKANGAGAGLPSVRTLAATTNGLSYDVPTPTGLTNTRYLVIIPTTGLGSGSRAFDNGVVFSGHGANNISDIGLGLRADGKLVLSIGENAVIATFRSVVTALAYTGAIHLVCVVRSGGAGGLYVDDMVTPVGTVGPLDAGAFDDWPSENIGIGGSTQTTSIAADYCRHVAYDAAHGATERGVIKAILDAQWGL